MSNREIIYAAAGAGESYWIDSIGSGGQTLAQYGSGVSSCIDSTGAIYASGITTESGQGGQDSYIAKLDTDGASTWQRTFGTAGTDQLNGFVLDSGNNSISINPYSSGSVLAKYNSSGTLQWQRDISRSGGSVFIRSVAVDSSDNIYVAGPDGDVTKCYLMKYNSSGTLQWQRQLGTTNFYNLSYFDTLIVAVDSSGNPYVAATYVDSGVSSYHVAGVFKYNSSGTFQWQRCLSLSGADVNGCVITAGSDVYVGVYEDAGSSTNAFVVKYNTSGTLQWQRKLSATSRYFYPTGIVVSGGYVYMAGWADPAPETFVVKYDTSGTLQWQRTLDYSGASNQDWCYGLAVKGQFFVIQGELYLGSSANERLFCAKLPVSGGLTGTYGSWAYASSSYTDAAGGLTDAAGTTTDAAASLTDSAASWTSASASLTVSTTTVP